ncbi:hypothetical protein, partial [Rhizobium sp. R634]|uniref:hypothetical protein n=1 Tax=Rhizobium sp. R634 TaxID=1764274 RepID=UPI001AEC8C6D
MVSNNAKSPLCGGLFVWLRVQALPRSLRSPFRLWSAGRGATIASGSEAFTPAITAVFIFGDIREGKGLVAGAGFGGFLSRFVGFASLRAPEEAFTPRPVTKQKARTRRAICLVA